MGEMSWGELAIGFVENLAEKKNKRILLFCDFDHELDVLCSK